MRPILRSLSSPTVCLLSFISIAACTGVVIGQRELPVASQPPQPRPEVYLYVDHFPKEPSDRGGFSFTLPLISAGYQSVREDDGVVDDMTYTLDFQAPKAAGEAPPLHRIAIIAGSKMVPKLSRQSVYTVTYYYHDRGMFLPPSLGLVIADESGEMLYLLSSDEAVPPDAMPEGLKVLPSLDTAFTTTRVTGAGCTVYKRHNFVAFTSGEVTRTLAPGTTAQVSTPGGGFDVSLFDCSVSDTEVECLVEDPPHFSFLLVRRPGT